MYMKKDFRGGAVMLLHSRFGLKLDLLKFFPIFSCGMSERPVWKKSNRWGVLLIVLFALAFLAGIALLLLSKEASGYRVGAIYNNLTSKNGVIFYTARTVRELEIKLYAYGLLNPYSNSVKPYILKRLPGDFKYLPAKKRKKLFIAVMLPIALLAKEQFDQERQLIRRIHDKMKDGVSLTQDERVFLEKELKKYRAKGVTELLTKVDSVPVSLLIAQAGIESGWGKSRFAILYNNIYGIHRKHRKPWQPIVCRFDNLYDATVAYMLNLDISPAYRRFRKARAMMGDNPDPYKLSECLTMYSIKRKRYIRLVQSILSANRLVRYDSYQIEQTVVFNYMPQNNIQ